MHAIDGANRVQGIRRVLQALADNTLEKRAGLSLAAMSMDTTDTS